MPDSYYRFLKEQGLGTGPEVAREYNFRIGLQNELPNYTNAAPKNLASAFSQLPQDFGRLTALTEQHLKKPESRDAFYGVAVRGVPVNLRPQFLAVVRETQERRKTHAQSPGAPMVREHPNKPRAGTVPQGSNSVSANPTLKPRPATPAPIIGTVSPESNAGEPARRTSTGYLPLAAVFAAGAVLWWFLTRSRPR